MLASDRATSPMARLRAVDYRLKLLALLLLLGAFEIATLRQGHPWGDDFAHYILQAKHLVQGDGMVGWEYLPNPEVLYLGPQTVPAGLSVLLAPFYAVFGLNFTAMKCFEVLCMLVALLFIDRLFEDRLPPGWRLCLVALIALNPVLFDLRDDIETEKPFMALAFLTLYLMKVAYRDSARLAPLWLAFVLGLSMFAAAETRNLGFSLFPTLLAMELFYRRRLTWFAVVAGGIAGLAAAAVSLSTRVVYGYVHLFNFSPAWISKSAFFFAKATGTFWWTGTPRIIAYAALLVAGIFAIRGYWLCVRQRPGPYEFLIPFYLAILIPYFLPGYVVYLLPLLPCYLGYALVGFRDLAANRFGKPAVAAAACAVLVLYGVDYARFNWGPIQEGVGDPQFVQLCDYIRQHTGSKDVFLFRKPRLLALMIGRTSSVYPMHLDREPTADEIWNYAQKIHARYLIVPSVPNADVSSTNDVLAAFQRNYGSHLQLTFDLPRYHLYRIE